MSEDPLRLTEMSDPPPELIALVRRMEGPPPVPPELPGLVAPRPRLRIVGPTLGMVTVAVGAYLTYQLVDAPPRAARSEPAAMIVEAPPAPLPPPPEPVLVPPIVEPPPLLEAPPPVLPAPADVRARSRPRPALPEQRSAELVDPFGDGTEAREGVEPGRLVIQTIPWAHVLIDGRDTGRTTPARLRVPAGRHAIGLRTEDGGLHTVMVTVVAGETLRIVRQLGTPEPRPRPQPAPHFHGDLVRPF